MDLDGRTAAYMTVALVALGLTGFAGYTVGERSVLASERLAAQNEQLYQLVTVHDTSPPPELMVAAMQTCSDEMDSNVDDCINNFLSRYGTIWVVNLVTGERQLLSAETVIE
jgi:hypothetical protein